MVRWGIIFISLWAQIAWSAKTCCSFQGGPSHCDHRIGRIVCKNGTLSPGCLCETSDAPFDIEEAKAKYQGQTRTIGPAKPDDGREPPDYQKCYREQQRLLSTDMSKCQELEFIFFSEEMNRIYKKILSEVSVSRAPLFKKAQDDWVTYKESMCTFAASKAKGQKIYPSMLTGCHINLIQFRIKDLEDLDRSIFK